jgi:glycosyltransferase involved in cell wall biosynthesis
LAPIDWPEPFGLNMIEAMACGTPTIAFRHGSVPEIIDDGISGIIVKSVEEAVQAVGRAKKMSRAACRNAFEQRFTARRMAQDYLRIYEQIVAQTPAFQKLSIIHSSESEGEPVANPSFIDPSFAEDAA